jgi:hypothetical protein
MDNSSDTALGVIDQQLESVRAEIRSLQTEIEERGQRLAPLQEREARLVRAHAALSSPLSPAGISRSARAVEVVLNSSGSVAVADVVRRLQAQGDTTVTPNKIFLAFKRAVRNKKIEKVGTRYRAPGRRAA